MHFHRDVIAACDCWPRHDAARDRRTTSSPAARRSRSRSGSAACCCFRCASARRRCWSSGRRPTRCCRRSRSIARRCCSPRRRRIARWRRARASTTSRALRKCVSAGEALPAATRELWKDATGIEIIDGIGATEMLHIFISHDEAHAKPGRDRQRRARLPRVRHGRRRQAAAAGHGRPARGQGADRLPLPRRRRASATTCRTAGTTPATRTCVDDDGYFVYQARTDDMIISAGYNIAGPRWRARCSLHPAVAECGVVGVAGRGARADRQGVRRAEARARGRTPR